MIWFLAKSNQQSALNFYGAIVLYWAIVRTEIMQETGYNSPTHGPCLWLETRTV